MKELKSYVDSRINDVKLYVDARFNDVNRRNGVVKASLAAIVAILVSTMLVPLMLRALLYS
jgi:hypothetical protein